MSHILIRHTDFRTQVKWYINHKQQELGDTFRNNKLYKLQSSVGATILWLAFHGENKFTAPNLKKIYYLGRFHSKSLSIT